LSPTTKAFWLGLAAIVIFSVTLPVTRVAVLELPPPFIAFGRAVGAGVLAACVIAWRRPPIPTLMQWRWVCLIAIGVVFGFPYFSTLAMQNIAASHGAILTGLLPLGTALMGAWLGRERPSKKFWFWAMIGSAIVVAFAVWRGGGQPVKGDWAMLAAVVLGALGYAAGGKLAGSLGGINTICWALIISLPVNLAMSAVYWPGNIQSVTWVSWLCFAYLAVFSMFIGFFFWYGALAMGGIGKVGLIQLLQPFITVVMASLINHEALEISTVIMAVVVALVVFNGRRS
jgi:drug/metabolite transporter (DMT)-like permease